MCHAAAGYAIPEAPKVAGSTFSLLHPESYPALAPAFQAWRNKDANRLVGQCLSFLGVQAQVKTDGDLSRWTFIEDSAVIFMSFARSTGVVAIESPLVRIPVEGRVGLYRMLLELNASALDDARFCLRDDIVVLTFTDTVENLAPPKLIAAIREVAMRADFLDNALSVAFSAPMVGPEAQRQNLDWRFVGQATWLELPTGAPAERAGPAAPDDTTTPVPRTAGQAGRVADLIRDLQAQLRALQFLPNPNLSAYLLHRGTVYRAAERFGATEPDAVRLLISEGQDFIHDALFDGDPKLPNPYANTNIYNQLIAGQVGQPSRNPELKQLASQGQIKSHYAILLAQLETVALPAAIQHYALLGLVAELVVRVPMAPEARHQVVQLLRASEEEGPTASCVENLWAYARRLR